MNKHFLQVQKTAKIMTHGNPETAKIRIFATHGYGQLAEKFIKNFEFLEERDFFVVVPEALSRFYLDGYSGKVGATWMTKEERQQEIKDYIEYLRAVYDYFHFEQSNAKQVFLGFSQGTSTISRFLASTSISVDVFLLWAGVFPPDIDMNKSFGGIHTKRTIFVYGNDDKFMTDEQISKIERQLERNNIPFEKKIFHGKHFIEKNTVLNILNTIK